jgi:hypothetical protein
MPSAPHCFLAVAIAAAVATAGCAPGGAAAPPAPPVPLAPPAPVQGAQLDPPPARGGDEPGRVGGGVVPPATAEPGSQLRRYTGGFLGDRARASLPLRARLGLASPLRLTRGGAPLDPRSAQALRGGEVAVVEQAGEAVRVLVEGRTARMLVWADPAALESVPIVDTRLALGPGRPPVGPAGAPQVGVWLLAGVALDPIARSDGWLQVAVDDDGLVATGWVEAGALGKVYSPPAPPRHERGAVREGARLTASPGGGVLASFRPSPGEAPGVRRGFEPEGPRLGGFQMVRFQGRKSWARGFVPAALFTPPSGRGSIRRRAPVVFKLQPQPGGRSAHVLPAGTDLLDEPGGEVVGRTLIDAPLADGVAGKHRGGLAQVELVVDALGAVRVWVDPARILALPALPAPAPAPAAPAAPSAAAPDASAPRPSYRAPGLP